MTIEPTLGAIECDIIDERRLRGYVRALTDHLSPGIRPPPHTLTTRGNSEHSRTRTPPTQSHNHKTRLPEPPRV